jgi:hypothetical protein
MRQPKPIFRQFAQSWYVTIRGRQYALGRDKAVAWQRYHEIMAAPLPEEVTRAGLVGPRLSAWIAYQKGACHMTYRVIQTFLADVLKVDLSTGQLAKVVRKASAALAPSYSQLQAALPSRTMVNVDETGHPENGKRLWSWGFHATGPDGLTLSPIAPACSASFNCRFSDN